MEKYLKASQVAARYNVEPNTVKRWIKYGYLPGSYLENNIVGSLWLVPESALKDFTPPVQGRPRKKSD